MSPDQRDALLNSLGFGISLVRSAKAAGTSARSVRTLAATDDDFAQALERAELAGAMVREQAARPPPKEGTAEVVAPAAPMRDVSPVWSAARAEAAKLAPGPLGLLLWLDGKLAAKGFPAMSPWWRSTIGAFYASGKRWLIVRVGRGGGKSTTLVRVAGCEALFTDRVIPPGQRWVWPFISASTTDAKRRVVELQQIFQAIGVDASVKVPHGQPTIELDDVAGQPVAFVSIASTIAGVSGPSAIGATIDEEAKLRDARANVNPATEILASLIQTFRARAGIRAIRCSSAWTNEGSHANAIEEGDNGANHVARIGDAFIHDVVLGLEQVAQWEKRKGDEVAAARVRAYARTVSAQSPNVPTWLANPTITAVRSREEVEALPSDALGGVPKVDYWLRENASVPMAREPGRGLAEADQITGLVEANRALVTGGARTVIFEGGTWGPGGHAPRGGPRIF